MSGDLLETLKGSIRDIDPVYFTENRITLFGKPFNIRNCGRKYLHDMYRCIGQEAIRKDGRPIVVLKSRQVEASTMMTNLDMYFAASGNFQYLNILHTFPQIGQATRFSKLRIDPVISDSMGGFLKKQLQGDDKSNTLTFKQFASGNTLSIEATSHDASRLRNSQFDVIFFDEVQDTPKEAINALTPALLKAKVGPLGQGVQVYFGTPKNKGSYFEQLWLASDQRHFYLGCENCGNYFLFYTPGSDQWENVWIADRTVQCTSCNHRQHKVSAMERGRWFPTPGKENAPFIGFHYNQLFIPEMTKEAILKKKPKESSSLLSYKSYMNEILGEFYEGAGAPITFEEIMQACTDHKRLMQPYIDPREGKFTFMGVDWGSASHEGGKSSTTIVIVSIDASRRLVIEYAKKLEQADWSEIKPLIMDLWRRYNVVQAVVDCGAGQVQLTELHQMYMDRVLGCWTSFNIKHPYVFDSNNFTITVAKDVVIEELINLLRGGKIRIPYQNPVALEWLIDHCSSMDMDTRTVQGLVISSYEKGSKPNDGMMALMYAMLAHRFKETNGFSVNKDLYDKNSGGSNMPAARLAYVPRM